MRTNAYDVLYEWSKTMDDAKLDEEENAMGNTFEELVRVSGEQGGVPVVVTYKETVQGKDNAPRIRTFDMFVADRSVAVECRLVPRRFFDGLLAPLRGRFGDYRTTRHRLFDQNRVVVDSNDPGDLTALSDTDYCDGLADVMAEGASKLELQSNVGANVYVGMKRGAMNRAFVERWSDLMMATFAA